MPNFKRPRGKCLHCGKELNRPSYKYCSNKCQIYFQRNKYIEKWKRGEIVGLSTIGTVSPHIKNYLREKFGNKCYICKWSEVNIKTNEVPLVADHIDGNWMNNNDSNLRLICPNCDALSPTFAGLNRGNGRKNRKLSKRVAESRILKNKPK